MERLRKTLMGKNDKDKKKVWLTNTTQSFNGTATPQLAVTGPGASRCQPAGLLCRKGRGKCICSHLKHTFALFLHFFPPESSSWQSTCNELHNPADLQPCASPHQCTRVPDINPDVQELLCLPA